MKLNGANLRAESAETTEGDNQCKIRPTLIKSLIVDLNHLRFPRQLIVSGGSQLRRVTLSHDSGITLLWATVSPTMGMLNFTHIKSIICVL